VSQPDPSAAQGQRDPYEGVPLILHRCPNCDRVFSSPSVCMEDGAETVPEVRPIKLALVKQLPPGQPMGEGIMGIPGIWADAYIAVDFEKGEATVFPVPIGETGRAGPSHTEGLNLRVKVERKP
jgi:hypothetical protein